MTQHRNDHKSMDDDPETQALLTPTEEDTSAKPSADAAVAQKRELLCVYALQFLASITFSILVPSLFLALRDKHDAGGSFVGWVVASFSLAQSIASPLFCYLAERRGVKGVLLASVVVDISGQLLYAFSNDQWMVLGARVVSGFSTGSIAVGRAYIGAATPSGEARTHAFVNVSMASSLGFVVGPAFGLVLGGIDTTVGGYTVDEYTAPAWIVIAIDVAVFALVASAFRSGQGFGGEGGKGRGGGGARSAAVVTTGMILCWAVFAIVLWVFSVLDTVTPMLAADEYDWGTDENSALWLVLSLISIVTFVLLKVVARLGVDDRTLLCGALAIVAVAWGIMLGNHIAVERYWVGTILIALSYPAAQALVFAVYSKLGPAAQGTAMGWLTASGSISRTIAPVVSAEMYTALGPVAVFATTIGITGAAIAAVGAGWQYLTPGGGGQRPVRYEAIN